MKKAERDGWKASDTAQVAAAALGNPVLAGGTLLAGWALLAKLRGIPFHPLAGLADKAKGLVSITGPTFTGPSYAAPTFQAPTYNAPSAPPAPRIPPSSSSPWRPARVSQEMRDMREAERPAPRTGFSGLVREQQHPVFLSQEQVGTFGVVKPTRLLTGLSHGDLIPNQPLVDFAHAPGTQPVTGNPFTGAGEYVAFLGGAAAKFAGGVGAGAVEDAINIPKDVLSFGAGVVKGIAPPVGRPLEEGAGKIPTVRIGENVDDAPFQVGRLFPTRVLRFWGD